MTLQSATRLPAAVGPAHPGRGPCRAPGRHRQDRRGTAFLAGHADQLPLRTQPCPEVTTMTMTEPGFPVRITRGAPVVTTPEEIDITNAGQLRAPLLHAAAAPARPSWST